MSNNAQPSAGDAQVTCPRCNLSFAPAQPQPERHPEPESPTRSGTVVMAPGPLPGPAPAATPTPTALPTHIGRFEIKRLVGEGMFGRVYEAYDPSLKRVVALKVARPEQLTSENRIRRFQREAQNAAVLLHPHIVALFDSGQDGNQHYIDGIDLSRVKRFKRFAPPH
jgi:Protein kinase domain